MITTKMVKSQYKLRRGGFAPALTDEEVITIEICGEFFKLNSDQDIFRYFRTHYQADFPQLTDRTLFVRQAQSRNSATLGYPQRSRR